MFVVTRPEKPFVVILIETAGELLHAEERGSVFVGLGSLD